MTLPTGTVTFLFTDIEGSTRLMREMGEGYVQLQMRHHELLRHAFRSNEGRGAAHGGRFVLLRVRERARCV